MAKKHKKQHKKNNKKDRSTGMQQHTKQKCRNCTLRYKNCEQYSKPQKQKNHTETNSLY